MIIGYSEIILAGGILIGMFALGAFVSSRLNNSVIKMMRRDMEHMKNNQRTVAQALVRREEKIDAALAVRETQIDTALAVKESGPLEVTIINDSHAPVPVENVNHKP